MIDDKKLQILIIDDDNFLLNMYRMKFEGKGFDVTCVSNSTEGLNKLREGFKPDIVLLDIIMPTLDGLEILKIMNDEKIINDSIVVMLTNQAESEEDAVKLGAKGFIVKAMSIPSEVVDQVIEIYKKYKK